MTKEIKSFARCLNCNRPETVIPLVNLRYTGIQTWICTQCLPILIHQPEQLANKLVEAERSASDPSSTAAGA